MTGTTTITEGGVLSISSESNLGPVPEFLVANSLVIDGGTLLATGNVTLHANRGIELGGNGQSGEIDVATGQTLTYGGIIGDGSTNDQLIVGDSTGQNRGTLDLTGFNNNSDWYGGGTTVSASLEYPIGSGYTLPLVDGPGNLILQGPGTADFTTAGSLGITGSVSMVDGASIEIAVPSGGPVVIAGAISGTGSVTIDASTTLQLGNGGDTGSLAAGSVVDKGALVYDSTGSQTLSNISGTGSLTESAAR